MKLKVNGVAWLRSAVLPQWSQGLDGAGWQAGAAVYSAF